MKKILTYILIFNLIGLYSCNNTGNLSQFSKRKYLNNFPSQKQDKHTLKNAVANSGLDINDQPIAGSTKKNEAISRIAVNDSEQKEVIYTNREANSVPIILADLNSKISIDNNPEIPLMLKRVAKYTKITSSFSAKKKLLSKVDKKSGWPWWKKALIIFGALAATFTIGFVIYFLLSFMGLDLSVI